MKRFKMKYIALLSILLVAISCHDLEELNINPNGAAPEVADLNLLLPTVITDLGQTVVGLGFGDIAGVMQHTQKTGWSGGHNDYDWNNLNKSWSGYYGILRNADELYAKAVNDGFEFHQGAALVLKAYTMGLITDLWGDAPYTESGKAEEGTQYFKPVFDPQRDIYLGILADLETANTLLSKSNSEYENINATQDLLYHGDVSKWRKFANSLALRYYMRLQAKEAGIAQAGIQKITSDPATYPVFTVAAEDANVAYAGNAPANSWPTNTVYSTDPVGEFMRTKMAATLVDALQALNDPRLGVWAQDIKTPLVLVGGTDVDRIVDGKREVSQDVIDDYTEAWGVGVDFDEQFVGIPPSVFAAPQYNLNPNLEQGAYNPHVSQLDTMYSKASGPLLQMRLLSAAEVHLILAEAAIYNWAPGAPEEHYAAGIRESFNAWGVGAEFDDYIATAPYNGLESIIQQKWIASWTAATEAWFDYRRTGFPDLQAGESAKREKLPLRFYYHFDDEISRNTENAMRAIEALEPTAYKGTDQSNNSAWSKMWVLQGTGKPY